MSSSCSRSETGPRSSPDWPQAVVLGVFLTLASCASSVLDSVFGPDGRTIRQEIETFPPEQKGAFALMQKRCTKCHTLDEPFSARLAAGSWRSQVRKMETKPGAGISPPEADVIAAFMEYFSRRRSQSGSAEVR